MKRFLLLWMTFILTTALGAYDFKAGDLYYNITSSTEPYTVEVTYQQEWSSDNYKGLTSITIPCSVDFAGQTYNVTGVGDKAFYGCAALTDIILPEGIDSIGAESFRGCVNLLSVSLPKTLTYIKKYAFYDCTNLATLNTPDSINTIGECSFEGTAFYNNKPDGCVYIGRVLYKYKGTMPGNTALVIRDSTLNISPYAFENCNGITSVTIPLNVKKIAYTAFHNCTNITSVIWNAKDCGYSDVYLSNSYGVFYSSAPYITSFVLGNEVEVLPKCLCDGMKNLMKITLPESLKQIQYGVFYKSGLTEITIPENVCYICDRVFYGCANLTSVVWNARTCITDNKVEWNWYGAFGSTGAQVTSFTLGEKVDTIPAYLCCGMAKLTGIIIPDNVKYIGDCAFQLCRGLKTIYFGKNLIEIGNYAFQTCTDLENVIWGQRIEHIGKYAFQWCTSLSEVAIPDSVKIIREGTFQNCTQMTELTIGKSVKEIEPFAFNCEYQQSPIEKVNYKGTVSDWCEINFDEGQSNPLQYSRNLYINETLITELRIPDGVAQISAGAFNADTALLKVYIPQSVEQIGYNAFGNCSNLEYFEYMGDKASCNKVLSNCHKLKYAKVPAGTLNYEGYVNNSWQWYNAYPSLDTLIVTNGYLHTEYTDGIHIPAYVDFSGASNTNMQLIQIAGDDVHTILLPKGLTIIDKGALQNSRYMQTITIPAEVTEIGVSAFENCRSLKSVVFEGATTDGASTCSLRRIGDWAFYNCHELQSLSIPEGVTEIGNAAFYGCTYLTEITLPSSVTSIDDNAFALCGKIQKICVAATTPPTLRAKTFYEVNRSIPVYVPTEAVNDYKSDIYWCEFNIQSNTQTAIGNTSANDIVTPHKILRNGQVLILRNGKTYTVTGIESE